MARPIYAVRLHWRSKLNGVLGLFARLTVYIRLVGPKNSKINYRNIQRRVTVKAPNGCVHPHCPERQGLSQIIGDGFNR